EPPHEFHRADLAPRSLFIGEDLRTRPPLRSNEPTARTTTMTSGRVGTVLRHIHTLLGSGHDLRADQELLRRFVLGREQAAFEALVHRHGPLVLGVCRRVLRHEHDAEDAFQATFLVLARKAGTIRQQESLCGWLDRVAYHIAVKAQA